MGRLLAELAESDAAVIRALDVMAESDAFDWWALGELRARDDGGAA